MAFSELPSVQLAKKLAENEAAGAPPFPGPNPKGKRGAATLARRSRYGLGSADAKPLLYICGWATPKAMTSFMLPLRNPRRSRATYWYPNDRR